MLIATFDNALPVYMFGAVVIAVAILVVALLTRLAQKSRDLVGLRILTSVAAVVVGLAGLGIGGVSLLLGGAINDCPPDAYECPF